MAVSLSANVRNRRRGSEIEMHDEKYCGHFLLRRVDFTPQKLSIELDRPKDNLVSVTFAMAATEFAEASQVVKIISGEIEPP